MADIPDCHCGALLQSALVGVQEALSPPTALSSYTVGIIPRGTTGS